MNQTITDVPCPTCATPVVWSSANLFRPFCSKRCQLIDLGEWMEEKHALPTNEIVLSDEASNEPF